MVSNLALLPEWRRGKHGSERVKPTGRRLFHCSSSFQCAVTSVYQLYAHLPSTASRRTGKNVRAVCKSYQSCQRYVRVKELRLEYYWLNWCYRTAKPLVPVRKRFGVSACSQQVYAKCTKRQETLSLSLTHTYTRMYTRARTHTHTLQHTHTHYNTYTHALARTRTQWGLLEAQNCLLGRSQRTAEDEAGSRYICSGYKLVPLRFEWFLSDYGNWRKRGSRFGLAVRRQAGSRRVLVRFRLGSPFSSKRLWLIWMDIVMWFCRSQLRNIKMDLITTKLKAKIILMATLCPSILTTAFLKRTEIRGGIEPRPFCSLAWRLTTRPNRLPRLRQLP